MYSNSLESTLHLASLALWPLHCSPNCDNEVLFKTPEQGRFVYPPRLRQRRLRRAAAICFAGVCCVMRPTAVALFLPLAAAEVCLACAHAGTLWQKLEHTAAVIVDGLLIALLCVMINGITDRLCYKRWLFPPWVNFRVNVLQNISGDYGVHPWQWYVTNGFPAMFASLLPLVLIGMASCANSAAAQWRISVPEVDACGGSCSAPGSHSKDTRPGSGESSGPPESDPRDKERCTQKGPEGIPEEKRRSAHGDSQRLPVWPALLAAYGTALYSAVPHKEFRFVLPQFELLLPYAAVPLLSAFPEIFSARSSTPVSGTRLIAHTQNSSKAASGSNDVTVTEARQLGEVSRSLVNRAHRSGSVAHQAVDAAITNSVAQHFELQGSQGGPSVRQGSSGPLQVDHSMPCAWKRWVVGLLLFLQLPMLAYFGLWHQRGTIAAAEWLADARLSQVCTGPFELADVGFL
jgi:hypothetical protein